MVKVDDSCIIKYKKNGETIEALVEFKLLDKYLQNKDTISVYDIFADTQIFSDSKKGDVASLDILNKVFGKKSEEEILIEIAQFGEAQIPTAYLNEMREKKRAQIIEYLASQTINPQSGGKYTPSMIESGLNGITFSINPNLDHIHQAEELLKELRKKMPIKIDSQVMIIQVDGQYVGNFYGPFRKLGTVQKEYYDDNGSLHIHMQVSSAQIDQVEKFVKENTDESGSYHINRG